MAETSRKGRRLPPLDVLGRGDAEVGGSSKIVNNMGFDYWQVLAHRDCQFSLLVLLGDNLPCSKSIIHHSEVSWRRCQAFQVIGPSPSRHGFLPCLDALVVIASQGCKGETFLGTRDYLSHARYKPAVSRPAFLSATFPPYLFKLLLASPSRPIPCQSVWSACGSHSP